MFTQSTKEAGDTKEQVRSAVNHLEEGSRRIKKDTRDTTARVRGDLDSIAHNVGEHVRDFVETAGEGMAQAKGSISEAGNSVATQIRENPLIASAVALGIGVFLGAFLRRH